jgi:TolA-binding protein
MSNEQDTVGISKLFDAIQNVQGKVSEVKQTLNNGIVKRTKENTKAVNKLYNKVDDFDDHPGTASAGSVILNSNGLTISMEKLLLKVLTETLRLKVIVGK